MTRTPTGGTFVPAHLSDLVPALEAEAMREAARSLLRKADALDGRASRVTFTAPVRGQCGTCGQEIDGPCEDCAPRPYGWTRNLGEQDMIARLDS